MFSEGGEESLLTVIPLSLICNDCSICFMYEGRAVCVCVCVCVCVFVCVHVCACVRALTACSRQAAQGNLYTSDISHL